MTHVEAAAVGVVAAGVVVAVGVVVAGVGEDRMSASGSDHILITAILTVAITDHRVLDSRLAFNNTLYCLDLGSLGVL